MTHLRLSLGLFGLCCLSLALAAEVGVYPAKTWDVRQLQADGAFPSPPFQALAQSREGLLYAGDQSGLLEYDGRKWRRLPLQTPGAVTLLGAPKSGGLVVGGPEFLLFFPRMSAPFEAQEPGAKLPDGLHGSGGFWEFAEDSRQWCVRSTSLLVCAAGDRFRGYRSKPGYGRLFQGQDAIYLTENHVGLHQVGVEGPKLIAGGEVFAQRSIYTLVESNDGRLRAIANAPLALWEWNRSSPPAQRAGVALDHVQFPVGIGLLATPGRLVLPEENGGVVVLDAEGELTERIEAGDLGVAPGAQAMLVDREGGLWLAWRNALSRIEYPSRLALFPMPGAAYGEYLGLSRTDLGVATWRGSSLFVPAPEPHTARWTLQERATGSPVILAVARLHGEDYLATVSGLWPLGGGGAALPDEYVWEAVEVTGEPEQIWAGLRNGLALLQRQSETWVEQSRVKVSFDVRSIKQSDLHTLWLGSEVGRVARLGLATAGGLDDATLVEFGQSAGLPKGLITVDRLDDRVVFAVQNGGFLEFEDGRFVPSKTLPIAETGEIVVERIIDGTQMLVGSRDGRMRLLKRDIAGVFRFQRSIFDEIVGIGTVHAILADPDGVVWLTADAGVVRVDPKIELPRPGNQQVLIREVAAESQPLFDGVGTLPAVTVKAGSSLRFGYALPSYRAPGLNHYRTRIRPLQGVAAWSPWHGETRRDFTNLSAGEFLFEVEASEATGVSGGLVSVPFTVVAPWYRRGWALAAFWLAALCLIGLGVQWRLRALRLRSAELERLVASKTEALRIAATTDPLTGLCNRHRFSEWMRDDLAAIHARAGAARSEDAVDLFVAAIDLDHFKLVNDHHGHAAGDAVLKAVAGRLLRFKRKDDWIFRFGGEEFVYLGVNCHRDDGKQLAEQIVAEIAELRVELDSGVLIQPTASLGWSVYPFYRERPDLFSLDFVITVADRALYLAKQLGRNQACGHLPNLAVDLIDRTQTDWRGKVLSRHPDFFRRV